MRSNKEKFQYDQKLKSTARTLRRNQTNAELLLWYRLKARQLAGFKFKRQHPINGYIVDFYCLSKKLAIELDGSQHKDSIRSNYDMRRTLLLRRLGVRIIRFWDNEVSGNMDGVLQEILKHLQE